MGPIQGSRAQTLWPTHEQRMTMLAQRTAQKIDSLRQAQGALSVTWLLVQPDDAQLLHGQALLQDATADDAPRDTLDPDLRLLLERADIGYVSTFSKGLWGHPWIVREAVIAIAPSVIRGESVRALAPLAVTHRDTLPWEAMYTIEADSPYYQNDLKPAMPQGRGWLKALLLAGTLGGTAALFYAIRSR